jgi:hypothetical protein
MNKGRKEKKKKQKKVYQNKENSLLIYQWTPPVLMPLKA